MAGKKRLGQVVHYFNKIKVAVIQLEGGVKVGDQVRFHGATTDFAQKVASMQVEHEEVTEGKAGEEVAIKVNKRVRKGDEVLPPGEED